jgi:hypothetical protein
MNSKTIEALRSEGVARDRLLVSYADEKRELIDRLKRQDAVIEAATRLYKLHEANTMAAGFPMGNAWERLEVALAEYEKPTA